MKTIYFIRHGKAEKKTKAVSDLKRSLSRRGRKEAQLSAFAFKKKLAPAIDCIVSSPAMRAMQTANIFMSRIGLHEISIMAEEIIYTAGSDVEILDFLLSMDDSKSNLLIVAHNPVLSDVIRVFMPEMKEIVPTAGIVGLAFGVDSWKEIVRIQPVGVYIDLKRKKEIKSTLTSRQKSDVREKTISFLIANLKELGVKQDEIPEENLAVTVRRIMSALTRLVDDTNHRAAHPKNRVKQNTSKAQSA